MSDTMTIIDNDFNDCSDVLCSFSLLFHLCILLSSSRLIFRLLQFALLDNLIMATESALHAVLPPWLYNGYTVFCPFLHATAN